MMAYYDDALKSSIPGFSETHGPLNSIEIEELESRVEFRGWGGDNPCDLCVEIEGPLPDHL